MKKTINAKSKEEDNETIEAEIEQTDEIDESRRRTYLEVKIILDNIRADRRVRCVTPQFRRQ